MIGIKIYSQNVIRTVNSHLLYRTFSIIKLTSVPLICKHVYKIVLKIKLMFIEIVLIRTDNF